MINKKRLVLLVGAAVLAVGLGYMGMTGQANQIWDALVGSVVEQLDKPTEPLEEN